MSASAAESVYQVWYCKRCNKACKIQPPTIETACRCESPVPGLRPTEVVQMPRPRARPMQALTDEEGRLRALARKGQRVRVTYEAEVVQAWTSPDRGGAQHIQFIVTTPDGRRHVVDPRLAGLHVEATEDGPS